MKPKKDMKIDTLIEIINERSVNKELLNVGAGSCKIDYYLLEDGYNVISTDYQKTPHFENIMKEYFHKLDYRIMDIFKTETYPVEKSETVLCCEVLEHLVNYKEAFKNLLSLTEKRLIVTIPWKKSFNMPGPPPIGHCNFWDDSGDSGYKNINEFVEMSKPFKVEIKKTITKPEDKQRNQFVYIIVVDKLN